ncbi:MAG: Gfo/Idh/MocA family oxidoreductase [Pseudomonadota bacterium]
MPGAELGVGIIGGGQWGTHHANVFKTLPRSRLIAACDLDEGRAGRFAAEHGAEASYSDHRSLLEHPGIDAVSVATPDFTHTQIILDALAAGKHVLTEKPLATTEQEAEAIEHAASASDRVVMVDFHNRVSPVFAAARDEVQAGAIGAAIHGSARLSNTKFVPLEMLGWSDKSSALWFLGSHAVDILRFVLGDEVARVFAVSSKGVLAARGVDTEDVHLAILEFSKGTKVTLENSWVLSNDNPQVFDFQVELVGEKGQIQLDPSHSGAFRKLDGAGLKYRDMFGLVPTGPGRPGGFIEEAVARFVDAVLDGAPVLASVADGLASTRVLSAIETSAASGQPVELG